MLPPSNLSKNQIDRLGDRLRKGDINEDDLGLLEAENEEALLQTHGRYFRMNPEDLPNQMDVGKSKAFATGLFQGARDGL